MSKQRRKVAVAALEQLQKLGSTPSGAVQRITEKLNQKVAEELKAEPIGSALAAEIRAHSASKKNLR
jgi:hypothetical protein